MEIWIVSNFWCFWMELLWISLCMSFSGQRHSFLLEISKTGIMHCKIGLGVAFYLVCSILLLRSKIVNRVSEGREIEKALVSRVSEWLVQCRARRAGAGKTPQRRPDANLTRDWGRLIGNQLLVCLGSGKAESNDKRIDLKNWKIFSLRSSFVH